MVSKDNPSSLDGMIERIEREAFEKWEVRSRGRLWRSLLTDDDGEYVSCRVFTEWLAWKARSALAGSPPGSEREAFEQYAIKAWGGWKAATMRNNEGDRYLEGYVDDSWAAWQARAAVAIKCRGVAHPGCNYLAPCGSFCDKCGAKT